ncbi:MAG TPA: ATP-grasp domain-containing protein [Myxococcota bacterium]|nr:ATP-grasp domain-containing protein [Myxococcota bacterium]
MHVLFVAPTLSANTVHVLQCLVDLEGVRLGVITHAPVDRLPAFLRGRLTGHYRVANALDATQLIAAVRAFQGDVGRVDRLLGFIEHVQIPLAITRDATGIPGMSEPVARNFRDKNRMKEVLRASGLPVARQLRVRSGSDLRAFVREVGYPIVLKPVSGVGSVATRQVRDDTELAEAIAGLHQEMQAEEFITGDERSFETILIDGQPVWWSSTHYMNRPLEILENPWMQWCVLLPREGLDAVGQRFLPVDAAALRALGLDTGIAHMEWFVRPDGRPVISEVGARPPGASFMTMMSQAHGVDMWARWAELAVYGRFAPMPPRAYAVGVAYLRAQGEGARIVGVHGLDEAQRRVGEIVVDRQLPQVGAARAETYEGDGWAMVRHPSTEVVRDALLTLVTTVRVEAG